METETRGCHANPCRRQGTETAALLRSQVVRTMSRKLFFAFPEPHYCPPVTRSELPWPLKTASFEQPSNRSSERQKIAKRRVSPFVLAVCHIISHGSFRVLVMRVDFGLPFINACEATRAETIFVALEREYPVAGLMFLRDRGTALPLEQQFCLPL